MTKPKEWEAHAALLHRHNNLKFIKPTQRMRESPVIERFDGQGFGDIVILVACGATLAVVVVLLLAKVIA